MTIVSQFATTLLRWKSVAQDIDQLRMICRVCNYAFPVLNHTQNFTSVNNAIH